MDEERIPVDEVQKLAAAGKNERDIITTLRTQGYSNTQIAGALNQVLKFSVSGDVPVSEVPPPSPSALPSPPQSRPPAQPPAYSRTPQVTQYTPQPPMSTEQSPFPEPGVPRQETTSDVFALPSGAGTLEMTAKEEIALEELIEEIINEKWRDVETHLEELDKTYANVAEKLDSLEKAMVEYTQTAGTQKRDAENVVSQFTEQMETLEGRVSSLERAFKDFLPSLTENVRSLSRIVTQMKDSKKK